MSEMNDFIRELYGGSYLEHHGVKGMKWYQHLFGKDRSSSGKKISRKRKKQLAKARKIKAQKAEEAKKLAEKKAKILKDPGKLYRNREMFTKEEIEDAIKTFDLEKRLRDHSVAKVQAGENYVQSIINIAEKGITGYNQVARIYNAFSDEDAKELPIVKAGDKKQKK